MHSSIKQINHIGIKQGQSTVEAALLIPLLFALFLLLLQPGIILYDKMIMTNAAAEGCRVLITQSESVSNSQCIAFVKRRLGSIPPLDYFHIHGANDTTCSYRIVCTGSAADSKVKVTVSNEIKPLPFIGIAASLLGITNANGNYSIYTEVEMPCQAEWVNS